MPKFIDITGKKFDNLIVEELSQNVVHVSNGRGGRRRRHQWICKCDCGGSILAYTDHLRSGHTKHCRFCPEFSHQFRYFNDGQGKKIKLNRRDSAIRQLMNRMKYSAKKRGLRWDLDLKYLIRLFEEQQGKCALSSIELILAGSISRHRKGETTASIDRIDSSKGYTKDNVQWLHKRVNIMKNNLSDSDFIQMCCRITDKHRGKNSS